MSAFYFGPLGHMVPLKVSAGVPVQAGRGFSEFVSSGGVRYVQSGRAAPRTWTVGRLWQGPDWVRLLSMAAHGMLPDCWLYEVAGARENMLPAQSASGNGAPVLVGGLPLGGLPVGHVVQVPLLGGRTYSVSAWCEDDATMLSYQLEGEPSETVQAVAGSGSASFTPVRDLLLTLTVTRAGVSGLRVCEGGFDGVFHPGYGTPCRVAVQDPSRVLQMLTDRSFSDFEVTLLEVGKPGSV